MNLSLQLVMACAATIAQSPDPVVFSAAVTTVYVDAVVTHEGQPVLGLDVDDFVVRDNGTRQRARLLGTEATRATTTLVFDSSASMAGQKLVDLKQAGQAILDSLEESAPTALLVFNNDVRLVVSPGATPSEVSDGLDTVEASGRTALLDALYAALVLQTPTRRRVIIAFTDGDDTASWLSYDDFLKAARRSDALLHIVSFQRDRNTGMAPGSMFFTPSAPVSGEGFATAMTRLAESTGGAYWEAGDSGRLRDTFLALLGELETRYVLSYTPAGVEMPGEHRIEVELVRGPGVVRARRGYIVR